MGFVCFPAVFFPLAEDTLVVALFEHEQAVKCDCCSGSHCSGGAVDEYGFTGFFSLYYVLDCVGVVGDVAAAVAFESVLLQVYSEFGGDCFFGFVSAIEADDHFDVVLLECFAENLRVYAAASVDLSMFDSGELAGDYFVLQVLVPVSPRDADGDGYDNDNDGEFVGTLLFHGRNLLLDNITHLLLRYHSLADEVIDNPHDRLLRPHIDVDIIAGFGGDGV